MQAQARLSRAALAHRLHHAELGALAAPSRPSRTLGRLRQVCGIPTLIGRLHEDGIGPWRRRSSGTKVREAVAVFDDVSSLEAAVDDLRAAGFGQHDISLLAAHAAVERKLGHMYRRVEELEDDPQAPRTAFVSGKNIDVRENRLVGSLTVLPTMIAAGTVVATAGAVAAAVVGTAIAGALLGTVFAHWMDQRHADWLQEQLDRGGILLWVRTPTEADERKALDLLSRYSAHDIHIHEIPAPA